jgi:flagellin FlaB
MMKRMKMNRRADVGIGAMIIFIASILVSAVAAGVLIQTANDVREQAQSTGDQAIRSIATGMQVLDVVGQSNAEMTQIDALKIYVRLNAGSEPINIKNMVVTYISGPTSTVLTYDAGGPGVGSFGAVIIKDVSGLFPTSKAMGTGDLVEIDVGAVGGAAGIGLLPSHTISLKLMPSIGMATSLRLSAPECVYSMYTSLG